MSPATTYTNEENKPKPFIPENRTELPANAGVSPNAPPGTGTGTQPAELQPHSNPNFDPSPQPNVDFSPTAIAAANANRTFTANVGTGENLGGPPGHGQVGHASYPEGRAELS